MPSRLAEIKAEVMYCMPMATVKHRQHAQSQGALLPATRVAAHGNLTNRTSFVKVSTDYARGGSVRLILCTSDIARGSLPRRAEEFKSQQQCFHDQGESYSYHGLWLRPT